MKVKTANFPVNDSAIADISRIFVAPIPPNGMDQKNPQMAPGRCFNMFENAACRRFLDMLNVITTPVTLEFPVGVEAESELLLAEGIIQTSSRNESGSVAAACFSSIHASKPIVSPSGRDQSIGSHTQPAIPSKPSRSPGIHEFNVADGQKCSGSMKMSCNVALSSDPNGVVGVFREDVKVKTVDTSFTPPEDATAVAQCNRGFMRENELHNRSLLDEQKHVVENLQVNEDLKGLHLDKEQIAVDVRMKSPSYLPVSSNEVTERYSDLKSLKSPESKEDSAPQKVSTDLCDKPNASEHSLASPNSPEGSVSISKDWVLPQNMLAKQLVSGYQPSIEYAVPSGNVSVAPVGGKDNNAEPEAEATFAGASNSIERLKNSIPNTVSHLARSFSRCEETLAETKQEAIPNMENGSFQTTSGVKLQAEGLKQTLEYAKTFNELEPSLEDLANTLSSSSLDEAKEDLRITNHAMDFLNFMRRQHKKLLAGQGQRITSLIHPDRAALIRKQLEEAKVREAAKTSSFAFSGAFSNGMPGSSTTANSPERPANIANQNTDTFLKTPAPEITGNGLIEKEEAQSKDQSCDPCRFKLPPADSMEHIPLNQAFVFTPGNNGDLKKLSDEIEPSRFGDALAATQAAPLVLSENQVRIPEKEVIPSSFYLDDMLPGESPTGLKPEVKELSFQGETHHLILKWTFPNAFYVEIAGTFSDPPWEKRYPLKWCPRFKFHWMDVHEALSSSITSKGGHHQFKYIIDGQWVCNPSLPMCDDGNHNLNNVVVMFPEGIMRKTSARRFRQHEKQNASFPSLVHSSVFPADRGILYPSEYEVASPNSAVWSSRSTPSLQQALVPTSEQPYVQVPAHSLQPGSSAHSMSPLSAEAFLEQQLAVRHHSHHRTNAAGGGGYSLPPCRGGANGVRIITSSASGGDANLPKASNVASNDPPSLPRMDTGSTKGPSHLLPPASSSGLKRCAATGNLTWSSAVQEQRSSLRGDRGGSRDGSEVCNPSIVSSSYWGSEVVVSTTNSGMVPKGHNRIPNGNHHPRGVGINSISSSMLANEQQVSHRRGMERHAQHLTLAEQRHAENYLQNPRLGGGAGNEGGTGALVPTIVNSPHRQNMSGRPSSMKSRSNFDATTAYPPHFSQENRPSYASNEVGTGEGSYTWGDVPPAAHPPQMIGGPYVPPYHQGGEREADVPSSPLNRCNSAYASSMNDDLEIDPMRRVASMSVGAWPASVTELLHQPETLLKLNVPIDAKVKTGLTLQCGAYMIPNPDKADCKGADAYFIAHSDNSHGVCVGIADGVGEWDSFGMNPRMFAEELMQGCMDAYKSLAYRDEAIEKRPQSLLHLGYKEARSVGSSTALVACLDDAGERLGIANLGDSTMMCLRRQRVYAMTVAHRTVEQQHQFNCPFQLCRLPTPEEYPALIEEGKGTLICVLQSSTIIPRDTPDEASCSTVDIQEGDLIIFGTDGVFDNLFDYEICDLANLALSPYEALLLHNANLVTPATTVATAIAEAAAYRSKDPHAKTPFMKHARCSGFHYIGGKMDDITVVACWVTRGNTPPHSG